MPTAKKVPARTKTRAPQTPAKPLEPPAGAEYEVTVRGEYWEVTHNQKAIRPYEVVFYANSTMKENGLLSCFRRALVMKSGQDSALLRMMKLRYPGYKRFRTHEVVSVLDLKTKKPVKELRLMNRQQVIRFIDRKGYPIDGSLYPTVTDLRQALKDYRDNPLQFQKMQETRRKTRGEQLRVMRDIEDLNDENNLLLMMQATTGSDLPEVYGADDIPEADTHTNNSEDDTDVPDDEDIIVKGGIPEFDNEDELDAVLAGI